MTFQAILQNVIDKTIARRRIGWFDHCSDSYDMRVAGARALRISQRLKGNRLTLRECM